MPPRALAPRPYRNDLDPHVILTLQRPNGSNNEGQEGKVSSPGAQKKIGNIMYPKTDILS